MKNILEAPFMIEMIRTATNMYNHGWDERNGGNISLMLDEAQVAEYLDTNAVLRTIPTGFTAPELDGKFFLVTGTGKYFKNVQYAPDVNLGIVRLKEQGQQADLLWGYTDGGQFFNDANVLKNILSVASQSGVFYCLFDTGMCYAEKPEFFASLEELEKAFIYNYCQNIISWDEMDDSEIENWYSRLSDDLSEFTVYHYSCYEQN